MIIIQAQGSDPKSVVIKDHETDTPIPGYAEIFFYWEPRDTLVVMLTKEGEDTKTYYVKDVYISLGEQVSEQKI